MGIGILIAILAVVAALVVSLIFPAAMAAALLAFGPFVLLGLGIAIYHFRKNPVFEQVDGDPVFSDEEHQDRAA